MAGHAWAADDDASGVSHDDAPASHVNAWNGSHASRDATRNATGDATRHATGNVTGDAYVAGDGRLCANDASWAAHAVCTHASATRPQCHAGVLSSFLTACISTMAPQLHPQAAQLGGKVHFEAAHNVVPAGY